MSDANSYRPRRGGLAWQVIQFLTTNPEESLQADDIAIKFDYSSSAGVHTALAPAMQAGMLNRVEVDGEYSYRLGTGFPDITPQPGFQSSLNIANTIASPRVRQGSVAEAAEVAQQLEGIEPEDGIPVPDEKRLSAAAVIKAKLSTLKPGQSIRLPITQDVRVRSAISEMNKAGEVEFTKRVIDEDHVRVWRIK